MLCIANYSFKGFWSHPKCMMQKYFPDVHTGKPLYNLCLTEIFIYFQSSRQRYNYFSYFFNSPFSVAFMQQTSKKQLQKSFPENKKTISKSELQNETVQGIDLSENLGASF